MSFFSNQHTQTVQRSVEDYAVLIVAALLVLTQLAFTPPRLAQSPASRPDAPPSHSPGDAPGAGAAQLAAPADAGAPDIQVTFSGVISGSVIAYTIIAVNLGETPVWDLSLTVPVPGNADVLMTDADDSVFVGVSDQELSFYQAMLGAGERTAPYRIWVSAADVGDIYISTQVNAAWRYVVTADRQSSLVSGNSASAAVTVVNGRYQVAVADSLERAPLGYVDLTRVDLYRELSNLRADIHVASQFGPVGEPVEYTLSIDADCSAETGKSRRALGIDYRIRYRHDSAKADVSAWNIAADGSGAWQQLGSISAVSSPSSQLLSMWIPIQLLDGTEQFCWVAEARRRAVPGVYQALEDQLPADIADPMLTRFGAWNSISSVIGDVVSSAGEPLQPDNPRGSE